jgi:hypothetical protein
MTIDNKNPTQQRQQPLSLSQALVGLPVRRIASSGRRRDPEEQRVLLRSILEQAVEMANEVDAFSLEDSSSDSTDDEEEENSSSNSNSNSSSSSRRNQR